MKELINKIKDKTQIVRRYMDYPKFLSLLTTKSIYFAKPNEFKDPLDALCPRYTNMENSKFIEKCDMVASNSLAQKTLSKLEESIEFFSLLKKVTEDDIKKIFDQVIIGSALDGLNNITAIYYKQVKDKLDEITDNYIKGNKQKTIELMSDFINEAYKTKKVSIQELTKKRALISCWQMCPNESDLMWQCYTNSIGIMIQTTVDKLEKMDFSPFLRNDASCIIDKVEYIDDLSEYHKKWNSMTIEDNLDKLNEDFLRNYFIKSSTLSEEKELRILIAEDLTKSQDIYNNSTGMNIKINMVFQDFIDKIVISPYAPNYYIDTLKCTMEKFGLDKLVSKISQSAIKIEQESLLK